MLWWWRESIFLYLIYSRTYVDQSEHNQLNIWEERETDWILEPKFGGLKNVFPEQKFHVSSDPKIFFHCPVVLEFWAGGWGQRKTEGQSEPENQTLFHPLQGHHLFSLNNGGVKSKNQTSCLFTFCRFDKEWGEKSNRYLFLLISFTFGKISLLFSCYSLGEAFPLANLGHFDLSPSSTHLHHCVVKTEISAKNVVIWGGKKNRPIFNILLMWSFNN